MKKIISLSCNEKKGPTTPLLNYCDEIIINITTKYFNQSLYLFVSIKLQRMLLFLIAFCFIIVVEMSVDHA